MQEKGKEGTDGEGEEDDSCGRGGEGRDGFDFGQFRVESDVGGRMGGRRERKRNGWIKVHIAVDGSSKKILNFVVTKENVHENEVFGN